MTGNEALKIAQAAIRWALADAQRRETREKLRKLRKELIEAEESGDLESEYVEAVRAQSDRLQRKLGAQVGGYRRGLAKACKGTRLAGVSLPYIKTVADLCDYCGMDDLDAELVARDRKTEGATS